MGTKLAHDVGATVFGTAVAGYGFAIGRDAWRKTKNNLGKLTLLICITAGFLGPYYAGRGIVRHHNRGLFGTLFKTLIGNILLWSIGVAVLLTVIFVGVPIVLLFFSGPDGNAGASSVVVGVIAKWSMLAVLIATFIGVLHGLIERGRRKKAFQIERRNERFLAQNKIEETGGEDITHVDGQNQKLRLLEVNTRDVVFMVVGQRGKRAYINLDAEGRMTNYTGIMKPGT